jgi:thioredoxin-like negative regulator of GroEL
MNATQPIVLDCHADWCKPCKKLTPILEAKAKGAKDWKLVKLDIDKFPEIAQALQIKAVPTVYLITGGRPVDGFSGMPDDKVLNSFFGSLEKILKLGM